MPPSNRARQQRWMRRSGWQANERNTRGLPKQPARPDATVRRKMRRGCPVRTKPQRFVRSNHFRPRSLSAATNQEHELFETGACRLTASISRAPDRRQICVCKFDDWLGRRLHAVVRRRAAANHDGFNTGGVGGPFGNGVSGTLLVFWKLAINHWPSTFLRTCS